VLSICVQIRRGHRNAGFEVTEPAGSARSPALLDPAKYGLSEPVLIAPGVPVVRGRDVAVAVAVSQTSADRQRRLVRFAP